MKLFFFGFFIFFSLSFIQAQAQVLIPGPVYEYNFNQFDWQAFSDEKNVQEYIEFRNEILRDIGVDFAVPYINIDKSDLARLEQELGLYKQGIKTGLPVDMRRAEEAVKLHWENIDSIEGQIKVYAGLGGSVSVMPMTSPFGKAEDYRKGVWELHKGDHEVVFNMVEKKDEALYKALGGNDEAYVSFIAPYMERYMGRMSSESGKMKIC